MVIKQLKDFPEYYISDNGNVGKKIGDKYYPPYSFILPSGYKQLLFPPHEVDVLKPRLVHLLVAEYFLEPIAGRDRLVHINGDKTNNSIENLKWTVGHDIEKQTIDEYYKVILWNRFIINTRGVVYSFNFRIDMGLVPTFLNHKGEVCMRVLDFFGQEATRLVKNLVAVSFIDKSAYQKKVIHNDGNKLNNDLSNIKVVEKGMVKSKWGKCIGYDASRVNYPFRVKRTINKIVHYGTFATHEEAIAFRDSL